MSFAVAAGDQLTAEAAADVLRAGGTAVDAAVAGALAACVCEPVLASLLGGGFLMVREAEGRAHLLDFFVQTPRRKLPETDIDLRAIEADFGETKQTFHIGAGAIAAQGVPRGLTEAHMRFGRMPLPELAAPAVRMAAEGRPLGGFQAKVLEIVRPIFESTPEALTTFGDGAAPLKAGDIYRNEALADVIDTYAREGDRFVMEGEVAGALLALSGAHVTGGDLKGYAPIWREPLEERRADARLMLNPPPSLGGALIAFALRLMPNGAAPADVARAFAATSRARLAANLNRQPEAGAVRRLAPDLAKLYADEVAVQKAATRGTTHISVIDATGMGAALTLSNGEGCGLIAPGTGLMPNNMLGEEDLIPGDLLSWAEDTRLSSMMAPMAIDWPDGRAAMLGSGGSNRIRTALAQVAAHLIDSDLPMEDAIAAPRLHVEGAKDPKADFEDRFAEGDREALLAAYPEANPWPTDSMFFGGAHGAMRTAKGDATAAGDPRREGVAIVG
ncbi:MAG: gamma-glutamyltransferase [Pseudomonadota bacterium]